MLNFKIYLTCLSFIFLLNCSVVAQKVKIPLGGNAFIANSKGAKITEKGIENWSDPNEVIAVYFRVAKPGKVTVYLNKVDGLTGKSVLQLNVNNKPVRIAINEAKNNAQALGEWNIRDTGYVKLIIKGISRTGKCFPIISSLSLGGTAIDEHTAYVKNNDGNFFYWGRRGPSVHLKYQIPENTDVVWFYNEVTVPKDNDVIGSYFMANGFGEGYFGMQVNSSTERRILFSVWSPFATDNPKEIPEGQRIMMLGKGADVYTGEFGDEGSGGQSYLKHNWKAGTTYKFLLRCIQGTPISKPNADGTVDMVYLSDSTTTYTAYFFAPELNKWQLIASFKRPKTQTYLRNLHSFLENFIPENGDQTRSVEFGNQWICDTKGNWQSLNKALFTTDNTGKIGYRKDYAGGLLAILFSLKIADSLLISHLLKVLL